MKFGLIAAFLGLSAAVIPTMAEAKAKTPAPEEQPCPVDEAIRVANAESLRRFSLLAGCADQLVEAEVTKETPRSPVRIIPRFIETEYNAPALAPLIANADGQARAIPAAFDPSGILTMRPTSYATSFDETIQQVAIRHSVDPLLLHAVIKQESGYLHTARSHVGAQGLMQIMPATGASLGVPAAYLNDAETNIDAGARLLKKLYYRYAGNFNLVLAAYNAGEGAVAKYGNRVPPYAETQNYVKSVMAHYNRLVSEQSAGAGTK
jgi:soluble lytic murein transglycosylase-like protein